MTILETNDRFAAREDPDVAAELEGAFREEGVEVHLGSEPIWIQGRSGESIRLRMRSPSGERTIEGSDILVAVGLAPNTQGMGLDIAGVALDPRGFIAVNHRLETKAPGVWAIGEGAGSPQFTHASFDDFRVVRDNIAGGDRSTRGRLIPYCLFTDPQLGRVGLNETEARQKNIAVRVARLPMMGVMRARTISETRGFMKALVEADGDKILGFAMVGPEAGEVTAAVQTAMLAGMPYTGVRDAIFTHPTMAEGLGALFTAVPAR